MRSCILPLRTFMRPYHLTTFALRSEYLFDDCGDSPVTTCLSDFSTVSPILQEVPSSLWAAHKYDVGLIKNAQQVVITSKSDFRPHKHQYTLKQEAIEGIKPVFHSLLQAGLVVPCPDSPVRTPIFPVKKIRDKGQPTEWRFVQDLQRVNAAVHARARDVPNPYTILSQIPPVAKWFSVVDLSNA
ncbi:hypothetical protein F2P81_016271 [Scophthalmus maximus]|uniref:Reverse transcriptase/retrotransposon-derived protein RNase H-like domain-containing protein n=1 Tax=Scophthalmus maximus TaxID=52904 RepID=A0A6A4S931_SCOMX|nr:hypothetical protein F2P81_016271 [Scophthalmus maximus]